MVIVCVGGVKVWWQEQLRAHIWNIRSKAERASEGHEFSETSKLGPSGLFQQCLTSESFLNNLPTGGIPTCESTGTVLIQMTISYSPVSISL